MRTFTIKLIPLACIILSVFLYYNLYNIDYNTIDSNTTLKNQLKKIRPSSEYTLGRYTDFNNYRFTLLLSDNTIIGVIEFKKGINNNYKLEKFDYHEPTNIGVQINPIGASDNHISYLIYGENIDNLLNSMIFTTKDKTTIESVIPSNKYFINYFDFYSSNNSENILTDYKLLDKEHNLLNSKYTFPKSSTSSFPEGDKPVYFLIFVNIAVIIFCMCINLNKLFNKLKNKLSNSK